MIFLLKKVKIKDVLTWILIIFVILWLVGFIQVPLLNTVLFTIGGHAFTLHNLLVLGLIIWVIQFLPGILRTIAIIILILWLLSAFGLFAGLGNILIFILILVILFSLLGF